MRQSIRLMLPVLALLMAGCGGNDNSNPFDPTIDARFRVVNVMPGRGLIDLYLEGLLAIDDITYGSVVPAAYRILTAGDRAFEVRSLDGAQSLASLTASLAPNGFYTLVATEGNGSAEIVALADDNTAPPSGNWKVRLMQAAPTAPAADLYITGVNDDINAATPVISNVTFRTASDYVVLPTSTGRIRVTETGTKSVLVDSGQATELTFASGQKSTLIVREPVPGGPSGYIALFIGDGD